MHCVIRADANGQIGTGHVMRTLAFAEFCIESELVVTLAYSECPAPLLEKWQNLGIQTHQIVATAGTSSDAEELKSIAVETAAEFVMIDGHHFCENFQRLLSKGAFTLVTIDDYGQCQKNFATIIINQNASASENLYSNRKEGSYLLLGPKYAMLRKEFRVSSPRTRDFDKSPERLLITTGGTDPHDASLLILNGIRNAVNLPRLDIQVLAGSLNPNLEALQQSAAEEPYHTVNIISQSNEMAAQMNWADIAVTGGGTTLQEFVQQGVPALVFSLVENQTRNAIAYAQKYRVCEYLGEIKNFEADMFTNSLKSWVNRSDHLSEISKRGKTIVDSRGADRILKTILNHSLHQ